jgi:hypothetical protein
LSNGWRQTIHSDFPLPDTAQSPFIALSIDRVKIFASFAKKIAGELDVGRFGRTLGEFDVV